MTTHFWNSEHCSSYNLFLPSRLVFAVEVIELVVANPAGPNECAADRGVDEVWASRFKFSDTRPFDEVRTVLRPFPIN